MHSSFCANFVFKIFRASTLFEEEAAAKAEKITAFFLRANTLYYFQCMYYYFTLFKMQNCRLCTVMITDCTEPEKKENMCLKLSNFRIPIQATNML